MLANKGLSPRTLLPKKLTFWGWDDLLKMQAFTRY